MELKIYDYNKLDDKVEYNLIYFYYDESNFLLTHSMDEFYFTPKGDK